MPKKEKIERKFIKEQVQQMNLKPIEKDILISQWGDSLFKTESEIKKILNRKENL
jgi:hypothetical protein|nr:MAG TPA: hypothetical protein [Caudoviricetes sp.]